MKQQTVPELMDRLARRSPFFTKRWALWKERQRCLRAIQGTNGHDQIMWTIRLTLIDMEREDHSKAWQSWKLDQDPTTEGVRLDL